MGGVVERNVKSWGVGNSDVLLEALGLMLFAEVGVTEERRNKEKRK